MREAVLAAVPGSDVFIGVAAVADYRPRLRRSTRSRNPAPSWRSP
jgi:phosphopantothenoylcysteine synthetase/decarboxylase